MKNIKFLVTLFLFAETISAQNADDLVIAKRNKIYSVVLGEERTFFVSTPPGYAQSKESYPVLYVLDGWTGVIGLANDLSGWDLCPQLIIVVIESKNGIRDFTPTKPEYDKDGKEIKYQSWDKLGEADKFLAFIETELFPYIDNNYRTLKYRICTGHSAGGLCVTYAFLSHNTMFNSYIAISPSLYWDLSLMNRTADRIITNMNLKYKQYYFSIGGKEIPSNIVEAQTFAQTLKIKAPSELKWKFDYMEKEDHGSQATLALINGLRFIYEGWKYDNEELVAGGLNAIDNFYNHLSERYGYEILPDVNTINSIGWSVLRAGRNEEAVKIFESNIRRYPNSPEAYNYLGEGYFAAGKTNLAIKSYEKAIELAASINDGNIENLKRRLEIIKENQK
jgi:predicted alpha/beta superfamily hydrolase